MPFKSRAQQRLFFAKAAKGEISKETLDEWNADTPKGKGALPERLEKKSMVKKAYAEGMAYAIGTLKAWEDVTCQKK